MLRLMKAQKRDMEGNLTGHSKNDPILNTRSYVVEFEDGLEAKHTANVIMQNIYTFLSLNMILLYDPNATAVN